MTPIERVRLSGDLVDFLEDVLGLTPEDIRAVARYMEDHLTVKEQQQEDDHEFPCSKAQFNLN